MVNYFNDLWVREIPWIPACLLTSFILSQFYLFCILNLQTYSISNVIDFTTNECISSKWKKYLCANDVIGNDLSLINLYFQMLLIDCIFEYLMSRFIFKNCRDLNIQLIFFISYLTRLWFFILGLRFKCLLLFFPISPSTFVLKPMRLHAQWTSSLTSKITYFESSFLPILFSTLYTLSFTF